MLEKTLESPLDCKETKPINPKGNQPWIFIERTDAEAELLILWPPDAKSCLIWKDPDAGKEWRQEEKGMTEDEMVGWHHWFSGHEFVHTPGDVEGKGGLVCCSPWGHKESNTTEWLNWTSKAVGNTEARWGTTINWPTHFVPYTFTHVHASRAHTVGEGQGSLACCSPWGRKVSEHQPLFKR